MAGICSAHWGSSVKGCVACNSSPRDLFPDWDEKLAEAEAAGTHKCTGCGFVFYRTVDVCPKCDQEYEQ